MSRGRAQQEEDELIIKSYQLDCNVMDYGLVNKPRILRRTLLSVVLFEVWTLGLH